MNKIKVKNREKKVRVGIAGASGYVGHELVKILIKHPKVELIILNSKNNAGKKIKELYPDFTSNQKNFNKEFAYTNFSIAEINELAPDIIFLALPHTQAMKYVPALKCKIIDLSADYRFKKITDYEKAYGLKHEDKITKAVYGLPELFKEKIKKGRVIANPGCYATTMILSTYPIQKLAKYIIFDCKSGWSGAGKESPYAKDSSIIQDNIIAYSLSKHRHKYEVEQFINTKISFTPQVIDTFRGMMTISHIILKKHYSPNKIKNAYQKFYHDCPFVQIVDGIPNLHDVRMTNKILLGGFEIDENNQFVIVSVLDNLLKGAAGQAVQNMNIMFGFDETEGLK